MLKKTKLRPGCFAALPILLAISQGLAAQNPPAAPSNRVVISDMQNAPAQPANETIDRVTLLDGSTMTGKILEMSATRVVIKTASAEFVIDPAKVERVERNIRVQQDNQRYVEIHTSDKSKYRGTIKRADANVTVLQSGGSEIPVKNSDIVDIRYLDSDKVRLEDAIASRPAKWQLAVKGGSMLMQLDRFKDLLSPGYFGLLQVQYPHFWLPAGFRLAPGLQVGYVRNAGKSDASTKIDLFPGLFTLDISYRIGSTPLDVYAQGLVGVSLTRVLATNPAERLSLDLAYGADLGFRYHITPSINVSLAGTWLAVSESGATLNHLGAYAGVGLLF
jgi:hypothetical protein